MMMLVNGQKQDQVSVLDRGLHYGDGVFETIGIVSGKPKLWSLHDQRLRHSGQRLNLHIEPEQAFLSDIERLAKSDTCVIKFIVTRGEGGRGYRPLQDHRSTRIAIRYGSPDYPPEYSANGVDVTVCNTRLCHNNAMAGIKHLNRLENVLARSEWDDLNIAEGLMLDHDGKIIEGTMSNIFIEKKDGILLTPKLDQCGVAGVQRENVIMIANQMGIETLVDDIRLEDISEKDHLFLCNSLIGIWPVRKLDGRVFEVGKLTRRFQQMLTDQI
ncbi:MAG: aminodeoxychorismate lyase [Gammaproteobacteria bacterium]|nr:MAG: aminodeoxychorismate lyase [Gammaproteobacteria bacterium]